MNCSTAVSNFSKLFLALFFILLLPGLLRANPTVPNIDVTLSGNLIISSGGCSSYTADYDLTVCNGYATLDQQGSSDINVGVCQTDGTCTFSQENPAESYSCTLTSDGSGTCTNTYSSCTYDVTFTATSSTSIPECETVSGFPSSADSNDPVNTSTGELFFYERPDLSLSGGPRPFSFIRYYASHLVAGGYGDSHLGNNWGHNFGWRLDNRTSEASVNTPEGRIIKFSKSGSVWSLNGTYDAPFQLVENSGEFTFIDPRVSILYILDDNNGGRLARIEDGKGSTFTLTYDSNSLLLTVSDGLGRTLTFSYGTGDRIATVTDGTRTVTFSYDATNLDLTSVTDPMSKVTTYSYDSSIAGEGKMTGKTRPVGNTPYTQTYTDQKGWNIHGRILTQTDANSNKYSFAFPTGGGTGSVGILNPESNIPQHTYNSTDRTIDSITDEAGNSYTMGYDSNNRRTSITDRLGDTTTYTYHTDSGKIASVTNADSTATAYTYTSRTHSSGIVFYDLTGITYPDSTTESFAYDSSGNMTSLTDRASKVWSFTYNSSGQVLTATNPLGGVTTNTYNADGTLLTHADATGNTTTFGYDSLQRLNLITRADSTTRAFTYDNNNNILTVTNENSNTTTFTYDDNNNLATITDPLSNATTFAYDNMDQISSVTDSLSVASSRTYDEMERLKTVTDRNGNTTTFAYDDRGRLTSITDGGSNVWSSTYDAESIIASTTNPLSNTTAFVSDKMGRITSATSPLSNATGITYDTMGRPATVQNPLGETTTKTYDSRGLVSNIALPESITASYTRNDIGQITAITDPNSNTWQSAYDTQGRLTSTTDPLANATSFTYNNRNRVSQVTYPDDSTLSITYDSIGNITHKLYSDNTDLNYTFDAMNRLTSAENVTIGYDTNGKTTSSNGLTITRSSGGQIATLTVASGKAITYTYDSRNLLTQVAADWISGTTTFTYDAAGRLTGITRPNSVNAAYTYDNEDRISVITEGSLASISLTRDAKGQLTSATRSVPLTASAPAVSGKSLTYDAASQVVSTYTYDAMGRLTDDGTRAYAWDMASRLKNYTENSNTVTFTYDATGKRVSRTEGGTTRDYVWNYAFGLPSISVVKESSSDLRYYVHTPNGALLYSIEFSDNSRRFYHYDEMGNALFLTDDSGTVIGSYAYSPYGELLGSTGNLDNPFTWQGKFGIMQEGTSGLYYMRARYYDSGSKRFISRDPVKSVDPREINPYQYVLGNPMRFVDPSGRKTIKELKNALVAALDALDATDKDVDALNDAYKDVDAAVDALESARVARDKARRAAAGYRALSSFADMFSGGLVNQLTNREAEKALDAFEEILIGGQVIGPNQTNRESVKKMKPPLPLEIILELDDVYTDTLDGPYAGDAGDEAARAAAVQAVRDAAIRGQYYSPLTNREKNECGSVVGDLQGIVTLC